MPRYRKIDPRIWNDEKFSSLSHEAQRMFFFVLTHPSMTALGAFRISKSGMADELGLDTKGFAQPFAELLEKGLVKYDERAFLLFAPNFLKYNPPENPNVIKGWVGAIDLLPECPLLLSVLERAKTSASSTDAGSKAFENTLGRVVETLSKRFAKPSPKSMANQEQEQEQEKEVVGVAPVKAQTKREPIVVFPETLPDEWRQDALKVRKDISPERVFLKLRGRYAPTSSKKTLGSWRRIFLDWVGREYADNVRTKAATPAHKDPAFKFTDDYYADSVNPDGTTNWGF